MGAFDSFPGMVRHASTGDPGPDVVPPGSTGQPPSYYEMQGIDRVNGFYWLIECFAANGNSAGVYWAGQSNRVSFAPKGLEITFDPTRARKIPLALGDLARDIAEAINALVRKANPGNTDTWHAVEHGFCR